MAETLCLDCGFCESGLGYLILSSAAPTVLALADDDTVLVLGVQQRVFYVVVSGPC